MKILYGIQGTGHGHISRAKELLPELSRHAEADVLISGYACQLDLGSPVRYRKHGISLSYDSRGGVSVLDTLKSIKPVTFITDVHSIPLDQYDLVISDYEPVTAWAAKIAGVPSVALSHQAAFLSEKTPRPARRSVMAEAILQNFAPADRAIGFHFRRYDDFIEPPIIRSEVRELKPYKRNHITVYLPAYHHKNLARIFSEFPGADWHIFSPSCTKTEKAGHIHFHPVGNRKFLKSFESCTGIITSAGFETSAEAMYLGKKLLLVPIRNQYEQLCNAAALQQAGGRVITDLESPDTTQKLSEWMESDATMRLEAYARPAAIISKILSGTEEADVAGAETTLPFTPSLFRRSAAE